MGVVSPVGSDLDTFWSNLVAGKSGVSNIEDPALEGYDCKIAGTVKDFDPAPFFSNPKTLVAVTALPKWEWRHP